MPESDIDFRQLLTDVVKKHVVILGPDIALLKARNVKGMTVAPDGTVTTIVGDPRVVLQSLIHEYVALSGLIMKKAMEPILAKYPSLKAS